MGTCDLTLSYTISSLPFRFRFGHATPSYISSFALLHGLEAGLDVWICLVGSEDGRMGGWNLLLEGKIFQWTRIGMSMSWAAVRSWSSDCPGVGGMGFRDP